MSIDPQSLAEAAAALQRGELLGMPTETVYGLAADAHNPEAIARVFALKGRPADHPLIVHLASADDLPAWALAPSAEAVRLANAFWPGPLTLVLRRASGVSDQITGGQDTVALRVPAHPVARALLQAFGGALVAPSANRFGRVSPTTAAHVRAEFGDELPRVLDAGPTPIGLESTIIDLSGAEPRLLRPGSISAAAVEAVLERPVLGADALSPRVPGALKSHYAPQAALRLVTAAELSETVGDPGLRVLALGMLPAGCQGLALPAQAADYGRGLYAAVRALDQPGVREIWVQRPPEDSEWLAVRDRLQRASLLD